MCRWRIVDTLSYNAIVPPCVSDICLHETKAFSLHGSGKQKGDLKNRATGQPSQRARKATKGTVPMASNGDTKTSMHGCRNTMMSRFLCVDWHMLIINGTMTICGWWIVDTLSYNAIVPPCVSHVYLKLKLLFFLEVGSERVTWRTGWQASLHFYRLTYHQYLYHRWYH